MQGDDAELKLERLQSGPHHRNFLNPHEVMRAFNSRDGAEKEMDITFKEAKQVLDDLAGLFPGSKPFDLIDIAKLAEEIPKIRKFDTDKEEGLSKEELSNAFKAMREAQSQEGIAADKVGEKQASEEVGKVQ